MSHFSIFLYTLAFAIGFLALFLCYRLLKTYRLSYLAAFLYYLFFHTALTVIDLLMEVLAPSWVKPPSHSTLNAVGSLLGLLATPLTFAVLYCFFLLAARILEKGLPFFFRVAYFAVCLILEIAHLIGTRNFLVLGKGELLLGMDLFLFYASYALLLIAMALLVLKARELREKEKRIAVRGFGIIYLLGFAVYLLFALRLVPLHYYPLCYFTYLFFNLPPLLWLRAFLRKQPLPPPASAGQKICWEQVQTEFALSPRDKEIIALVLAGKSNRQIEDELYLSAHTIKNYIYKLYRKLGVKNRVQLANLIRRPQNGQPPL
jgi:DNA-binding CsgD family transcriptional regulator